MSANKRWCPHCKRATEQMADAGTPSSERIIFGAVSLGVSELFVDRFWRCLSCGNKAGKR